MVRWSQVGRAEIALLLAVLTGLGAGAGCRSAAEHREDIDKTAYDIIGDKQAEALGKVEPFDVNRPSDILRRRLLMAQDLPYAGGESLGTDQLEEIEHWPEPNFPQATKSDGLQIDIEPNEPVKLSLLDALRVGARNSFAYQDRKEQVFASALDLELERNEFRNFFFGTFSQLVSTDLGGDETVSGTVTSGEVGVTRQLEQGATITSAIAVDLANLLSGDGGSSRGIIGDASISIPLLRGSGRHIVTEPLTQAERNVVYAMWEFERFKKEYAVDVASSYLAVLRQLDVLGNTEADYKSRISSSRRTRRLADAGRIQEIEVDQAVQNELSARQRWIGAQQQYEARLDTFKNLLGLPTDAHIALDPNELESLAKPAETLIEEIVAEAQSGEQAQTPAADEAIVLAEPNSEGAGPLEMESEAAIRLALENRLDLRVSQGEVYDAQRAVVVAADALRAELTLLGRATAGEGRSIGSARSEDAELDFSDGFYSALATLDLPLERTREAVFYRDSYIALEQAARGVQELEDTIKLQVRSELRTLLEARESLYIQAKAVYVAQKRVRSVNLFLEAGRAQVRDLLEAQDSLLQAQIDLIGAVVDYRIAELEIQRDMGVLEVSNDGLWREYRPETKSDV